jgi:hypothetical protein
MDTHQFIITIVAIVLVAGIIRRYIIHRAPRVREDPKWKTKVDALEERVRTLERIVTDKGYDLHREFDKL